MRENWDVKKVTGSDVDIGPIDLGRTSVCPNSSVMDLKKN
jgi:hypothetical protein